MKAPKLFLSYTTEKEPQISQKKAKKTNSPRPMFTPMMKKMMPMCPKSSQKKARKSSDGELRMTKYHAERLQMAVIVCIMYKMIAVICYWQLNL